MEEKAKSPQLESIEPADANSELIEREIELERLRKETAEAEKDAIEAIASEAFDKKTGARGLRSILENTLRDVMYEITSDESINKCIITKESVEGKGIPFVVRDAV